MTPGNRTKSASIFAVAAMASMAFHIPAHGEVSVLNSSSPAAGGAGLAVSATDLVNQGQATFLNYTEGSPTFGAGTANEGTATNLTSSGAFYRTTQLPATLVFNLDVSTNTLGYDLTQIDSLAGWQGGGTQTYANQNFTVEYSVVGNAGFSALTAVDYSPFASTTSGDPAYTQSQITDTTGVLASGVDALRFVYSDPSISGGTNRGLVLLEIDIAGTPTGPAGPDNTPPNLAGGDIVDDKSGGPVVQNTQVTYTVTFSEDIDAATVSAADFGNAGSALIDIGTINEISPGVFRVRVTPTSVGTLQLQVAAGAVIKDPAGNSLDTTSAILDDTTIAVTTDSHLPSVITIASPTSRHIVQRSVGNTGDAEVSGAYTSMPSEIQARAVVMAGAGNSGTTTGWQTIDPTPTGGTFSGVLAGVPAGGWYQLEVRGVTDGGPGAAAVMAKIGVGDIYVTAGQSNAANHGAGGFTATDDRVSVRTSVAAGSWVLAADPVPIASGGGGSVWTRLGGYLAAAQDIPVGFLCVGVGATQVSQWLPGTSHYNDRLRPAVQSFGRGGFRAVLWHQGESDALASVAAGVHASRLISMISQSRTDAGWDVPWYLAEAAFHPSSNLAMEEPVVAGQRRAVWGDPLTFLGPSTDEFHLEGKLNDSVHFNNAGLLDHARQWSRILLGATSAAPRNGDFEENSSLADGASHVVNTTANNSPSVLGWRILSSSGTTAADGSNGYHNPSTGTYAAAVDSSNDGELPHMDGRHVAMLDGGSIGNHFLHSTRALAAPNQVYTLTVALGVRDDPARFGGARIEILANGTVVATESFDKAALDTLHGGDASGSFTDASVTWTTGGTVLANQPLAIRIAKDGGAGTVLDFDQVRFTLAPTHTYGAWIAGSGLHLADQGFHQDPDGDGLDNGIEAWLGTDPGQWSAGLAELSTDGINTIFTHPHNPSPPGDVSGSYQWSTNLSDWYANGSGPGGGSFVTMIPSTAGTVTTVTATASEVQARFFVRIVATRN